MGRLECVLVQKRRVSEVATERAGRTVIRCNEMVLCRTAPPQVSGAPVPVTSYHVTLLISSADLVSIFSPLGSISTDCVTCIPAPRIVTGPRPTPKKHLLAARSSRPQYQDSGADCGNVGENKRNTSAFGSLKACERDELQTILVNSLCAELNDLDSECCSTAFW